MNQEGTSETTVTAAEGCGTSMQDNDGTDPNDTEASQDVPEGNDENVRNNIKNLMNLLLVKLMKLLLMQITED